MDLIAIHTINRREKGKPATVKSGEPFSCPEEEGEYYLRVKAASVAPVVKAKAETKPATKKPAAKPTAAEKKAAKDAKDADAATAAAKAAEDELLG